MINFKLKYAVSCTYAVYGDDHRGKGIRVNIRPMMSPHLKVLIETAWYTLFKCSTHVLRNFL